MATLAAPAIDIKARERRFYSRMAIVLMIVAFIGFAPSFYLRGIVPAFPRPNPTLPAGVMFHGLLFTAWMLLFIAQTQLVKAGRRDVHMTLGKLTMLVALLMIPVMYLTSVWQVARANQPPFTDPLTWTIVPLAAIPAFAILVWQGWQRRRKSQWHKRLLLSAAIVIVAGPAIGRLPIAPPSVAGMSVQLLLGLALFVPLFMWDKRTSGQVHPATWLGFGLVSASVAVPLLVFWTGADWASIAQHLPGVGA